MEVLSNVIRNVTIILLMTAFLDILLPSGNMQRFVKVVMSLFILITLLSPVLDFVTDRNDLAAFNWYREDVPDGYVSALQTTGSLEMVNQELLRQNYALRLEKQMEAIVNLVKTVPSSRVTVQLDPVKGYRSAGNIQQVQVVILARSEPEGAEEGNSIQPVRIGISAIRSDREQQDNGKKSNGTRLREAQVTAEKDTALHVKNTLAQYFNLKANQIQVLFESLS